MYVDDFGSAHAELSASGSDRWLNCAGSVKLSRGLPEPPSSIYAREGTTAHALLEKWLWHWYITGENLRANDFPSRDMYLAVKKAVVFIQKVVDLDKDELIIEKRVSLAFVRKGMFGTTDIGIIRPGKILEVWDYKHGAGMVVDVTYQSGGYESLNTQLAYYALGLAFEYDFDFPEIKVGVIQPRAKHKTGASIRSHTMPMRELKKYEYFFKKGVERVYSANPKLFEGSWCHWCKAKPICPLKQDKKFEQYVDMFD